MGVVQRGRSRLWFDDQGWWVCLIEFQPSSWTRGSYLNVGVQWLWDTAWTSLGAFMYAGLCTPDVRVSLPGHGEFVEYETDEQFAPLATILVTAAAKRVQHFRGHLPSIGAAASGLDKLRHPGRGLDAGIALALAGEAKAARERLAGYLAWHQSEADPEQSIDWQETEAERARSLLDLVDDLASFREQLRNDVNDVRTAIGLSAAGVPW